MIWLILILAVIGFCLYHLYRHMYHIQIDNTVMFTGAPGTGKTNEMVTLALKLRRKINNSIKLRNWFQRFKMPSKRLFRPLIEIYSNIPIRVGRLSRKDKEGIKNSERWKQYCKAHQISFDDVSNHKFCNILEIGHLLNQIKVPIKSVVVVTELGSIASQYDWGNINVQEHMDDWIRHFRQYTKGGYFLGDDQSSDNVAVNLRRRIGTVHNMLHFKKWFKLYWVSMRNMTISEDIKVVETNQVSENMKTHFGLFPLFFRNYDTYAFSDRYNSVPEKQPFQYVGYKTNSILELPVAVESKYYGEKIIQGDHLSSKLTTKDS